MPFPALVLTALPKLPLFLRRFLRWHQANFSGLLLLGTPLQPQPILSVGKVCDCNNVSNALDVLTERGLEICDDRHLVFTRRYAFGAEFADSIF